MRKIPLKLRSKLSKDPYYKKCCRGSEGSCDGRITWEHAFIYAGTQIQEGWAIVPLCEYHHAVGKYQDGGDLNKDLNQFIALSRALDEELKKFPRKDWTRIKAYLMQKFQ
jgi:protein involved in ribonucleotide reduction